MVDLSRTIAVLEAVGSTVEPCGSRVTCNPPPIDTDQDFLVVIPDDDKAVSTVVSELSSLGFHWEGNAHYQSAASDGFMSWRQGDVNLIVTSSADFAHRHRAATVLCTRLNLQDKQDRIALFQAVLYGNQWGEEKQNPPITEPSKSENELPW